MKRLNFLFTFALMLLFSFEAFAGFRAYNSSGVNLKLFDTIECSTGLTCSRVSNKLRIISSPTVSSGTFTLTGDEATDGLFYIESDQSDDSGDSWRIMAAASGNAFTIANDTSGSYVTKFTLSTAGALTLPSTITMENSDVLSNATDDVLIFSSEDNHSSIEVKGFEAKDAKLLLYSDEGDDNADKYSIEASAANVLAIKNNGSALLSISSVGAVSAVGDLSGDGGDQLVGFLNNQVAATATTLTAAQCGSSVINSGAVEIELPEASTVLGCRYTFIVGNASAFDIDPDAADQIVLLTNAAGDRIEADAVGESVTIEAISASEWAPVGAEKGTWSDAN